MRVLIVNKFFYPRGGDCQVAIGTREILLEAGHDVRIYAMSYPDNIKIPDSKYFASEVDFNGGLIQKIKAFNRLIGMGDIVNSFLRVLNDFKPDIVHVHNIHSYLSPVICKIAHDSGVPVVWTLHDYKIVCPAYILCKPNGLTCDYKMTGKCNIIRDRCLKNSLFASLFAWLESKLWPLQLLERKTDAFISPSYFMNDMMEAVGVNKKKLHVLYNFIDPQIIKFLNSVGFKVKNYEVKKNFFSYTGRLSKEKGLVTLINAVKKTDISLVIAGDGPMRSELENLAGNSKNIKFLGRLGAKDVAMLQRDSLACICPSEWYENNPLAVIESLCAGTPVIGAEIGGIPELITPEINGMLFKPGDVESLLEILTKFNPNRFDSEKIAESSRKIFSKETHIKNLLTIYRSCIGKE